MRASASPEQSYIVGIEVENITGASNIQVTQLSTMGALWTCSPLGSYTLYVVPAILPHDHLPCVCSASIPPHQTAEYSFGATPWRDGTGATETTEFVARKIEAVLKGDQVDPSEPSPIDLTCTHLAPVSMHGRLRRHAYSSRSSKGSNVVPLNTSATRHFLHCGRRTMTVQATASAHPDIPSRLHRSIFPLYNPSVIDIVIFWELPAQRRAGHILLQGPTLGVGHAALKEIIEAAETMKVKRSMYAETQRERQAILEAVKKCEWNRETDPISVLVQDGSIVDHDFRQG